MLGTLSLVDYVCFFNHKCVYIRNMYEYKSNIFILCAFIGYFFRIAVYSVSLSLL